MFFRAYRGKVNISDGRRDYDEYHGLSVNLKPASGVDLDTLFDQDLLWA